MALAANTSAPDLALTTLSGESFVLSDQTQKANVVLFFFNISCPVCQYAAPFFQRLWQAQVTDPVRFLAVSQDDRKDTEAFVRKYGLTFPVAIDDAPRYRVSSEFKLTTVPTIYLVSQEGDIKLASVGWSRADFEQLNTMLSAESAAEQPIQVIKPGEEVAEFKAG
jgi:peroxiredoxin